MGWGATEDERPVRTMRNSFRPGDLANLQHKGEASDLMDADGKRSCRKTLHAEEREKAMAGDRKGCLETERSEARVP